MGLVAFNPILTQANGPATTQNFAFGPTTQACTLVARFGICRGGPGGSSTGLTGGSLTWTKQTGACISNDPGTHARVEVWTAPSGSGVSGTLALTLDLTCVVGLDLVEMTGHGSDTPTHTYTAVGNDPAVNVDVPANGGGVAQHACENAGGAPTWSGFTSGQYSASIDAPNDRRFSAAHAVFSSAQTALQVKADNPSTAITGAFSVAVWSASVNTYTLTAAAGGFDFVGADVGLNKGKTIVAAAASFALAGQDAALTLARKIIADVGAFVFTGIAANLLANHVLAAALGAFSFTGINVTLNKGKLIHADVGSFTFTGTATIMARLRQSGLFGATRKLNFVLQKLRVTAPTLEQ